MVTHFLVTKIRKVRSRFIELSYPEITKKVKSIAENQHNQDLPGCNESLKPG
jgi:hypothetical protein